MQLLPFKPSVPFYTFTTPVTDDAGTPTTYVFDVSWNGSDNAWYMNVFEQDRTLILASIKLVLGTYLGRRCNHDLFRKGVFIVFDTTNSGVDGGGTDAGLDDMGTRVKVVYMTRLELATLAGIK